MPSGIYQILNKVNGKRYVGSSINLEARWGAHLRSLRRGQHCNPHLQCAFDKYGEECFAFEVLEHVEHLVQLIPREQHYLDAPNPEYNTCPTAGSPLGRRATEETRKRLSEALSGEKNPQWGKHPSEETRRKQSVAARARTGKRSANYGKRFSAEYRAKIGRAQLGKRHSAERCRRISDALKGHPVTEETRQKLREAAKGQGFSAEHREKISRANKGHPVSRETRTRISQGLNAYWRRVRNGQN